MKIPMWCRILVLLDPFTSSTLELEELLVTEPFMNSWQLDL